MTLHVILVSFYFSDLCQCFFFGKHLQDKANAQCVFFVSVHDRWSVVFKRTADTTGKVSEIGESRVVSTRCQGTFEALGPSASALTLQIYCGAYIFDCRKKKTAWCDSKPLEQPTMLLGQYVHIYMLICSCCSSTLPPGLLPMTLTTVDTTLFPSTSIAFSPSH